MNKRNFVFAFVSLALGSAIARLREIVGTCNITSGESDYSALP